MFSFRFLIKNILVIVAGLVLSFVFTGCATVNGNEDAWFGRDKFYHFATAGVIGAGVSAAVDKKGTSNCKAPVIGVSAAIGLGAGKELYDRDIKKKYWSWKDMFWNLLGGTAGSLAVSRCD